VEQGRLLEFSFSVIGHHLTLPKLVVCFSGSFFLLVLARNTGLLSSSLSDPFSRLKVHPFYASRIQFSSPPLPPPSLLLRVNSWASPMINLFFLVPHSSRRVPLRPPNTVFQPPLVLSILRHALPGPRTPPFLCSPFH